MYRIAAIVALALAPSLWFAWESRDIPYFGSLHDDSLYYVSAKSLAEGKGYRLLNLPGEPAATKYPWLFPAYLSLAWMANPEFPQNLGIAVWLVWIGLPVFVWFSFQLIRRMGFADWESALIVSLAALTPTTVLLSATLMSEITFCALLAAALWLAETADGRGRALAAGVVAGLALLVRMHALPLLVTAPLLFFWRRQAGRAVAFGCGMLPALVAWTAWSAVNRAPDGGDMTLKFYLNYLSHWYASIGPDNFAPLVYENAWTLAGSIGKLLVFNVGSNAMSSYLSQLLGVVAIVGTVRLMMRRGLTHWGLHTAGMGMILALWNYAPMERFPLPLFPLLAAGFYSVVKDQSLMFRSAFRAKAGAERVIAGAGLALTGVLVGVWALQLATAYGEILPAHLARHRKLNESKEKAYTWIRAHTPAGESWIAWNDGGLFLRTGRKAVSFHVPTRLGRSADRKPVVDYYASLPWPATLAKPGYLLWTEDSFEADVTSEENRKLRVRLEQSGRAEKLFDAGAAAVYRLRL